jgi:phosphonate transport system permease protein
VEQTLSVSKTPPPLPDQRKRRIISTIVLSVIFSALVWSWVGTEFSSGISQLFVFEALHPSSDKSFIAEPIRNFFDRLFPPDLSWSTDQNRPFAPPLRQAGAAVAITLQIAIMGTVLGMVAALMLGFLGAENLTPHWVHHPIKVFLALLRSIPVILLALLFVASVGFGPFPGVMAVAIHSVGMLGKLFSEECEGVDGGIWEAMDSAGANWLQKVRYAIWPQVAPQIYSLTLFRLDMNIRDSAVLGFVGVAGLGLMIENYRKSFDYASVCTVVIVTMIVVLIVDQISFYIRRQLK